jgi:hypothetical protein
MVTRLNPSMRYMFLVVALLVLLGGVVPGEMPGVTPPAGAGESGMVPDLAGFDSSKKGMLEDRPLVVRVYLPGQEGSGYSPSPYSLVTTAIEQPYSRSVGGTFFTLGDDETPEGSVVVVIDGDQSDATVSMALGNGIRICLRDPQGRYSLQAFRVAQGRSVLITDALGAPLPEAEVRVRLFNDHRRPKLDLVLEPFRTNEDGYIEMPEITADQAGVELMVHHPGYGASLVSGVSSVMPVEDRVALSSTSLDRELRKGLEFVVNSGLVARDSEAWARAFRGRVIDPDGQPVAGATAGIQRLIPKPERLYIGNQASYVAITDEEGRFAIYPEIIHGEDDTPGPLLAKGTLFKYEVRPPAGRSLPPRQGETDNIGETEIRLEEGRFHTFAFEDMVAVDPALSLALHQSGWKSHFMVYSKDREWQLSGKDLKQGAVLPEGMYYARRMSMYMDNMQIVERSFFETQYPPIEVTSESPEELVFRLPDNKITVTGKIVHAVTQEPLEGVFVSGSGDYARAPIQREGLLGLGYAEGLSPEQWALLESLPAMPSLDDLADPALLSMIPAGPLARSGPDGQFTMKILPGHHFSRLGVWAQGFMPYQYSLQVSWSGLESTCELPPIPMFPAATVSIKALSPVDTDQFILHWEADGPPPGLWALPLLSSRSYITGQYNFYGSWRPVNTVQRCYVPAGFPLNLSLMTSGRLSFEIPVAQQVDLAQGQDLELNAVSFPDTVEVLVQVVDEDGQAYEEPPVNAMVRCGLERTRIRIGNQMAPKSVSGNIARFEIPIGAQGVFEVREAAVEGEYREVVVKSPFSLEDGAPEASPYRIVLPRGEAGRVFGKAAGAD